MSAPSTFMSAAAVCAERGRVSSTERPRFGFCREISAVSASSRSASRTAAFEPVEVYAASAGSPDMIASRASSATTRLDLPPTVARPVGV